tara:strand:- start:109 stop:282 length:174 start_codon:yes stop_codon:yes gene_type:complete
MTNKEIEEIEYKLNTYKNYNDIPQEFLLEADRRFSTYAYIKSLIELKKEESLSKSLK